jgi:hypothetical protein
LGDEFAELVLSFPNGNRFHIGNLERFNKNCSHV